MKALYFVLMLGATLTSCVPIAREVSWQTEQRTITIEEGKEVIGLGERKKKSSEDNDFSFEDGETVVVPQPFALPILPWKNEVIDFTQTGRGPRSITG